MNEQNRRVLMAVFAHPDDEAFGTGGTLARYAAEGVEVYLVAATRGEAGQIAAHVRATEANLPMVRENELRCACQAYGIHAPIFLDYIDGQMAIVHQGQAVGKVVRLIRELRPDVLVTFGPDGIYGHYDHIAAHRWATIAAELAAKNDCFPDQVEEGCQPHRVRKVYYTVLSASGVERMTKQGGGAVMMDGVPFHFFAYPDSQISATIDVGPYAEAKLAGIRCYASQFGLDSPYFTTPDQVIRDPFFCQEHLILADSAVGLPEKQESDLFERIEQPVRQ